MGDYNTLDGILSAKYPGEGTRLGLISRLVKQQRRLGRAGHSRVDRQEKPLDDRAVPHA